MAHGTRLAAAAADPLSALRRAAGRCQACPLWEHATQTVFGVGNPHARIMLVGEQPGDAEDIAGSPFVGPAGKILDAALVEAGLERPALYVTNAVKHFKWELRGKRRMHKTPAQREIEACRQWLDAELEAIEPELVICLGGTATRALIGRHCTLKEIRGRIVRRAQGPALLATVHPSYVLRAPVGARDHTYQGLVADLKLAAQPQSGPATRDGPRKASSV